LVKEEEGENEGKEMTKSEIICFEKKQIPIFNPWWPNPQLAFYSILCLSVVHNSFKSCFIVLNFTNCMHVNIFKLRFLVEQR